MRCAKSTRRSAWLDGYVFSPPSRLRLTPLQYSTGPRLRSSDLRINEIFRRWTPNPVLVIVDVSGREGFPTDAYFAVEEIKDDGTSTSKTFVHTPSTIEAEEAEEIGVEHLLRDIRDVAVGTLSTRVTAQLQSLQGLHLRLREIGAYLQKVLDGELPVNHAILGNLQDIFNLLPNISTPPASRPNATNQVENSELARAMRVKTNDQLMTIYLSSLVRAITAFHDLIDNKIQNRQQAEEQEAKKDEEKKDGEKDDKKATTNGESKKESEEDQKSKGKKKS
jgi:26S proteasome regulatory subunit N8